MSSVAVDPESTATAAAGVPPDGADVTLPDAGANTFICSDPPANAICSLPHSRKSNSTRASCGPRNCTAGNVLAPDRTTSVGVSYQRAKFSTHPRSSHGDGGESSANTPLTPGSKIVGVSVARFTGAKYARICRITGTMAARNGEVLIKALPPKRRKLSAVPAVPRAHPDKPSHTSPAVLPVPDRRRCCLPPRWLSPLQTPADSRTRLFPDPPREPVCNPSFPRSVAGISPTVRHPVAPALARGPPCSAQSPMCNRRSRTPRSSAHYRRHVRPLRSPFPTRCKTCPAAVLPPTAASFPSPESPAPWPRSPLPPATDSAPP